MHDYKKSPTWRSWGGDCNFSEADESHFPPRKSAGIITQARNKTYPMNRGIFTQRSARQHPLGRPGRMPNDVNRLFLTFTHLSLAQIDMGQAWENSWPEPRGLCLKDSASPITLRAPGARNYSGNCNFQRSIRAVTKGSSYRKLGMTDF